MNTFKKTTIALITLIASTNVIANSVFKCDVDGVITFSQVECGEEAEKVRVDVTKAPKLDKDAVFKQCVSYLIAQLKDPDSARVGGSKTRWDNDKSGARRILSISINAKNSYGGYGGSRFMDCYVDHSGQHMSKIQYLVR